MATSDHRIAERQAPEPVFPFRIDPHLSPASVEVRQAVVERPEFGRYFTDHMALVDWTADVGWHDPRVVPLAPFSLHPAAAVLHYGQEIFEGLKVYRHPDGHLRVFRPELNARRMQRSAQRLALPVIPQAVFLASIDALIAVDREWVPAGPGDSLYLRPFLIATETFLGVRAAKQARYGVIASPAGKYFDDDTDGVSLWLSTTHALAGPLTQALLPFWIADLDAREPGHLRGDEPAPVGTAAAAARPEGSSAR